MEGVSADMAFTMIYGGTGDVPFTVSRLLFEYLGDSLSKMREWLETETGALALFSDGNTAFFFKLFDLGKLGKYVQIIESADTEFGSEGNVSNILQKGEVELTTWKELIDNHGRVDCVLNPPPKRWFATSSPVVKLYNADIICTPFERQHRWMKDQMTNEETLANLQSLFNIDFHNNEILSPTRGQIPSFIVDNVKGLCFPAMDVYEVCEASYVWCLLQHCFFVSEEQCFGCQTRSSSQTDHTLDCLGNATQESLRKKMAYNIGRCIVGRHRLQFMNVLTYALKLAEITNCYAGNILLCLEQVFRSKAYTYNKDPPCILDFCDEMSDNIFVVALLDFTYRLCVNPNDNRKVLHFVLPSKTE